MRDEVRAARLAEKRGDDRPGTPRFEGRAAADPGPSLRAIVGGYLAEWRAAKAGAAVASPDEPEGEEDVDA